MKLGHERAENRDPTLRTNNLRDSVKVPNVVVSGSLYPTKWAVTAVASALQALSTLSPRGLLGSPSTFTPFTNASLIRQVIHFCTVILAVATREVIETAVAGR
jgi:hypothetical protein